MNPDDIKRILTSSMEPSKVVHKIYYNNEIAACSEQDYQHFRDCVAGLFESVEDVRIMGSGNYGFSLNPDKLYQPFRDSSDIDTVVISKKEFNSTWGEIRNYHRHKWYSIGSYQREQLLRNGQNIYAGFISPKWIPDKSNKMRFRFIQLLETIPGELVNFKKINMLFFKDLDEVFDYYKRSIMTIRR